MAEKWTKVPRKTGIYRRPSPSTAGGWRYRVWYRDAAKKHRTRDFSSLAEAEHFHAGMRVKTHEGTLPDVAAGRITLREFGEHFLKTSPHLRAKTAALYESQFRVHVVPILGDRPIASIRMADVKTFEAALRKRDVGAATVGGVLRLLHRVFAEAIREGRITSNPTQGVRTANGTKRKQRILTEAEVARVAGGVPDRYEVLVWTLAIGGLRIGEATALRVSDLDLEGGVIHVSRNAPEVNGKKLLDQPTKTERSERDVFIPSTLAKRLRAHVDFFTDGSSGAIVFTTGAGAPVQQSEFRRHVFQPAAKRAGVEPRPTVHDLRHSSASWMARHGFSMLEAGQQLGHSHTAMTAAYSHLFPEDRAAKAELLANVFESVS